jgi:hypothetical protein
MLYAKPSEPTVVDRGPMIQINRKTPPKRVIPKTPSSLYASTSKIWGICYLNRNENDRSTSNKS